MTIVLCLYSISGEMIKVSKTHDNLISQKNINKTRDDLLEISYHDGIPESCVWQEFNNGYGTVFDLSIYENATLEMIDFHHSQYGLQDYPHNYNIHIVNWETKERLVLLEDLSTTVIDDWETEISLGSIDAVDLVGIFIEPLSNTPTDAYPDLDYDIYQNGASYIVNIADYSDNNPGLDFGDFLLDLWINVPVNTVIQEDFIEGIPGSWTLIDADGDLFNWESYDEDGHDDSYCIRSGSYISGIGPLTPDNYLVLPKIEILNSEYFLKFWVKPFSDYFYEEHYKVKVSTITDTIQIENFTEIIYEETLTPGDWQQISISLSDYAEQEIYLAFEHCNSYDQSHILLDDISVSENIIEELDAEFYAAPTSGTSPLEVQFTDNSAGNPTSWEWDFGDLGSGINYEQNPTHTYENNRTYTVTLTVTDDSLNTDTEIKTDYISVYDEALLPPTNLQAEVIDDNDVHLTWNAPGGGGTGTILVVDRDGSYESEYSDDWIFFMDTLDNNGYEYEYWEVEDISLDGPDYNTMQNYDIIIWFSGETYGYYENDCMTSTDEDNLSIFLDNGGSLFLSSQDYLWASYPGLGNFTVGQFPYEYLALRSVSQDAWEIISPSLGTVEGATSSIAEGFAFNIQDIYTNSRDGLYIDQITNHVGTDLFNMTNPSSGICALQYDDGNFRTVFTTASFAAITESTIQSELMSVIIDYLSYRNIRDLLGYNVYKDEIQINTSIVTDLSYNDPNLDFGTYQYTVTAVYDEGESIPTNPTEVIIAEEDLKAAFSGTPTSGNVPLTVQFTDLSTGNPTSWEWDFGDGETSSEQNPAHNYISTGNFTVSLTVSDGTNESTEFVENYIYVYDDDFLPPTDLQAQVNINDVYLSWLAPGGGGVVLEEDFEQGTTPDSWIIEGESDDTSQLIPGYWSVNDFTSTVDNIEPIDSYHCGLFWSYEHQDEWLITPEFECSSDMNLEFWSTVFEGSTYDDHYYIKVSDDDGSTWDTLWDASDLSSGNWNCYNYPYTIDLSSYAGQNIKIAFNAVDDQTDCGIYYVWFVDNITASNGSKIFKFNPEDFTYKSIRNSNNLSKSSNEYFRIKTLKPDTFLYRDLIGYNVYRDGSQINTTTIIDLFYNDQDLANGTYEFTVSAVYDEGESVQTSPVEVEITGEISYIYPGDANNDGIVDTTDIVPIGTYWRKQGNSREYESFSWDGFAHPGGWSEFDAAYADCNGDGEVNITDVLAILLNWGETHSVTQEITITPEMIEAARDNFIEIYENLGNSENEIKIKNHIADLFGLPQIEFIEKDFLYQNYPNPYHLSNNNIGTNISYQIAKDGFVELSIYNIKGQLVKKLVDQTQSMGKYSIIWNGKDNHNRYVSSGIYLYRLKVNNEDIAFEKMILIR